MTSRVMLSLYVAASAALAVPALAQTPAPATPPAAPAPAPAAKPAMPAKKPMMKSAAKPAAHPTHMAKTMKGAPKSVSSQDAAVDRLNSMSLQSAQQGQTFAPPTGAVASAPSSAGASGMAKPAKK